MPTGLYLVHGGAVMVAYGTRKIPIPGAQYKANGYRPALEKLGVKSPAAHKPVVCPEPAHSRGNRLAR